MKNDKTAEALKFRFSRIIMIFTPILITIVFIPVIIYVLLPDVLSIGYITMINSCERIIALTALCAVSIIARKQYGKEEFKKLTTYFMLFAILFLIAEFLWYLIPLVTTMSRVLFFIPHVFWVLGYLPLVYACWTTVFEYSEYAHAKDMFLTSLLMIAIAVIILIPVSLSIISSQFFILPGEKVLAIIYPFLDCIVLFSLVIILQIYRIGKLAFYWLTVTAGIIIFTVGDISSAFINAYGLISLNPITSTFFIFGYSYLTLSLGVVGYLQWRFSILEPEGQFTIRQIFLINRSGVMITHIGQDEKNMDTDIVSSMFTAVQDFVKDSFDRSIEPTKEKLRRLQYGGLEIEVEHGKYIYLAVVLDGVGSELLHSRMKKTVELIEQKYEKVFIDWNGDRDLFIGIEKYLRDWI